MNRHRSLARIVVDIALSALLASACGAGVTSTTGAIIGKVEKDGQPAAGISITLVNTAGSAEAASVDKQTDVAGRFAFENISPGTYYLIASLELPGQANCSTNSPGFGLLKMTARKNTGDFITLAMATGSEEPFEVSAGDQLTKDIVFNCR